MTNHSTATLRGGKGAAGMLRLPTGDVPFIDAEAVYQAVSPAMAIRWVREGFLEHAAGRWEMPPKTYLHAGPDGDFRAMPAGGEGIAVLKWASSFPSNPRRGLPTVTALVIVNDAATGRVLAVVDGQAVTALRTGAAAAVAASALARPGARTVGLIGCGLHGRWAAICLAAAGLGPGVCVDRDPASAKRLADELGWAEGGVEDALGCDVVTTVTPGIDPVIRAEDLRPGVHVNALGADGPGKAELTLEAVGRCELFCDEREQASHGGELASSVARGLVDPLAVTELGTVLNGSHPGRSSSRAMTLFDSTGLAIQDLAIVLALMRDEGITGDGRADE